MSLTNSQSRREAAMRVVSGIGVDALLVVRVGVVGVVQLAVGGGHPVRICRPSGHAHRRPSDVGRGNLAGILGARAVFGAGTFGALGIVQSSTSPTS